MATAKKKLHPTLRANADRLKRGEPLYKQQQRGGGGGGTKKAPAPQRPKIRSKKGG